MPASAFALYRFRPIAAAVCAGVALLAAAALFTHVTFAGKPPPPPPPPPPPQPSSGTLVFDLPAAWSWGLAAAPSGTIYVLGSFGNLGNEGNDSSWHQLVLSSSDSGSTWSLLDDFAPPGRFVDFQYDLGGSIALDSTGDLT